jgi:hypothetical protein
MERVALHPIPIFVCLGVALLLVWAVEAFQWPVATSQSGLSHRRTGVVQSSAKARLRGAYAEPRLGDGLDFPAFQMATRQTVG